MPDCCGVVITSANVRVVVVVVVVVVVASRKHTPVLGVSFHP